VAKKEWREFKEARKFARRLGFTTCKEWLEYYRSGEKPNDIPTTPDKVYEGEWTSWGNFLGTGNQPGGFPGPRRRWRPFPEAKEYVHMLGLSSAGAWKEWCTSGKRPDDIPSAPQTVYVGEWRGWEDWLGTRY